MLMLNGRALTRVGRNLSSLGLRSPSTTSIGGGLQVIKRWLMYVRCTRLASPNTCTWSLQLGARAPGGM